MESALFYKLCKECCLLNAGLTHAHVDLTFSKATEAKVGALGWAGLGGAGLGGAGDAATVAAEARRQAGA